MKRRLRLIKSGPGKLSLALAGGYAIQAHGIGSWASGDVGLFVNWARQDDFDDAVNAVIGALEAERMEVTLVVRAETFARLLVTDPSVVLTHQPGKTHRPARAIGQAVKLPEPRHRPRRDDSHASKRSDADSFLAGRSGDKPFKMIAWSDLRWQALFSTH